MYLVATRAYLQLWDARGPQVRIAPLSLLSPRSCMSAAVRFEPNSCLPCFLPNFYFLNTVWPLILVFMDLIRHINIRRIFFISYARALTAFFLLSPSLWVSWQVDELWHGREICQPTFSCLQLWFFVSIQNDFNFVRLLENFVALCQRFATGSDFVPQGTFGSVWQRFWLSWLGGCCWHVVGG